MKYLKQLHVLATDSTNERNALQYIRTKKKPTLKNSTQKKELHFEISVAAQQGFYSQCKKDVF